MNTDDQSQKHRLEKAVKQVAIAGNSKQKPKYYTGLHGQYADLKDFDTDRMVDDFSVEFPSFSREEVRAAVVTGIWYWYMK
jgi:hypothetical protein